MAWNGTKAELELAKWFTPSKPATRNYVGRGTLDKTIFREFSQQGRQVLVYGPTGSGRTSMVLDNLEKLRDQYGTNSVRVSMTNTTTLDSFIADVANKLNLARQIQTIETNEDNIKGSSGIKVFNWFNANLEGQNRTTTQDVVEKYTGTDDFSILEEALFKRNTVLVVDDMENLTEKAANLRIRLSEIAKNMSDDAVNYDDSYAKIIFVGIASTAEQLWHDVQSLKSRLATISVPYLNADESSEIIKNGWDRAKLESTDNQINKTAYISSGIGKVVHELGQKTGYAAVDNSSPIIKDEYISEAIHEIFEVNELDYASKLNNAKNKTGTKTTVRNYVLYVMANDDRTTMTIQDILKSVNKLRKDSDKGPNSISPALTQLKSSKFDVLTSEDRNSWRFIDPMFKAYVREHKEELLLKNTEM
ncbi:ATP-binding protein [Companilactobacillus hulinensis]|uniref:ATP-binding protein n=1 Tax=Companilactobacillus hulinensis TaxID=2486007 RepID=UPI0013DE6EB0|nr:ATP-binding protein [Companilactobacillus hulinensis]